MLTGSGYSWVQDQRRPANGEQARRCNHRIHQTSFYCGAHIYTNYQLEHDNRFHFCNDFGLSGWPFFNQASFSLGKFIRQAHNVTGQVDHCYGRGKAAYYRRAQENAWL
jgi:hypothetical protein